MTPTETIKVCPADSEPVMFTLEHPGIEYVCLACGWGGDIFGPCEAPASDDLIARRDELLTIYEQRRGIAPPDQNRAPPTCLGCGTTATGRLDGTGKPAHWYVRTIDGVTEYACSRDCISGGMVLPW